MEFAIDPGQRDLVARLRQALVLAALPVIAFSFGLRLASLVFPTSPWRSSADASAATFSAPAPADAPPAAVEPGPEADAVAVEPALGPAPGGVRAPSPDAHTRFHASPIDPRPAFLDGVSPARHGRHFIVSDEWNHHLLAPQLRNIGGGYVGVGATQGYVLIGWARPEYAWFIDYDDTVVELHEVWRVVFELAPTPAQLLRAWSWEQREATRAAIEARRPGAEGAALAQAYRRHRARVSKRLMELRAKHLELGVDNYLTHGETFEYVRGMVLADRVRPMRVDLTASRGLAGIAEAARELGVAIRVLYTSNAQTYWSYDEGNFPANVQALPFDDRSLVVHTIGTHSSNGDYRYIVHHGQGFQARLRDGARSVYQVTPWRQARRGSAIQVERVGFGASE